MIIDSLMAELEKIYPQIGKKISNQWMDRIGS